MSSRFFVKSLVLRDFEALTHDETDFDASFVNYLLSSISSMADRTIFYLIMKPSTRRLQYTNLMIS